jgi:hypothetical protein
MFLGPRSDQTIRNVDCNVLFFLSLALFVGKNQADTGGEKESRIQEPESGSCASVKPQRLNKK